MTFISPFKLDISLGFILAEPQWVHQENSATFDIELSTKRENGNLGKS
jgi:hypothetical protein